MYWLLRDSFEKRVQMDKIPYDKWLEQGLLRLCNGNSINYGDITVWFVEMLNEYGVTPLWIYYDSYSAKYWVEEMEQHGFKMVRCIQGAKTLSLSMQQMGTDLQAKKINYNNSPILKWCLTNTGIETDRNGNIVPVKNQAAKMGIDGTASMLDAYVGLFEHHDEFYGAAAIKSKVEVIFKIRWRDDIDTTMRVRFRGIDYGITRIDEFEGYKQDLTIYAYAIN